MLQDTLANALSNMKNYESTGKSKCMLKPASKLIKDMLQVIQKKGYIGNFEYVDDGKAGQYQVNLIGKINNCGVIKPRYPVKVNEIESWEKKFLPARGFGALIMSTPDGVMTHDDAKAKKTGGVLLAYIY